MEEYIQHMKTLRSHMNDVEDQAAKTSIEEQMQITTIQTLTKEIDLAKGETKRLKEDSDLMMKAKGQICSQILERQRKIALLENDSSTLSQTLELIQQEIVNLSTKIVEKRTSYNKTEEEINITLKEQQEWVNLHKPSAKVGQHSLVDPKFVMSGNVVQEEAYKSTMTKLDAAKTKFDTLRQTRSELASEHHKVKQSLEKLKCKMDSFKMELRNLPIETLEQELEALQSDKHGELQYQESLQEQIDRIKGISHMVKCGCGEEYLVDVDHIV